MQTIDELSREFALDQKQSARIQQYLTSLIIELLRSLRDENSRNFDETIESLRDRASVSPQD